MAAPALSVGFVRAMDRDVETVKTEKVIDLRGIRCPHVVLRARKALRDVPIGGMLVLECTDPLTVVDVPHFVNQTKQQLESQERRGELFVFRIIKLR